VFRVKKGGATVGREKDFSLKRYSECQWFKHWGQEAGEGKTERRKEKSFKNKTESA